LIVLSPSLEKGVTYLGEASGGATGEKSWEKAHRFKLFLEVLLLSSSEKVVVMDRKFRG